MNKRRNIQTQEETAENVEDIDDPTIVKPSCHIQVPELSKVIFEIINFTLY